MSHKITFDGILALSGTLIVLGYAAAGLAIALAVLLAS